MTSPKLFKEEPPKPPKYPIAQSRVLANIAKVISAMTTVVQTMANYIPGLAVLLHGLAAIFLAIPIVSAVLAAIPLIFHAIKTWTTNSTRKEKAWSVALSALTIGGLVTLGFVTLAASIATVGLIVLGTVIKRILPWVKLRQDIHGMRDSQPQASPEVIEKLVRKEKLLRLKFANDLLTIAGATLMCIPTPITWIVGASLLLASSIIGVVLKFELHKKFANLFAKPVDKPVTVSTNDEILALTKQLNDGQDKIKSFQAQENAKYTSSGTPALTEKNNHNKVEVKIKAKDKDEDEDADTERPVPPTPHQH